jgi:hypothetical protein
MEYLKGIFNESTEEDDNQNKKIKHANEAVVDQAVDQQKKVDEAATSNQVDEAGNQAVVDQAVDQQKKVDEAVVDQAVVDQAVVDQAVVDQAAVDEAGNQAVVDQAAVDEAGNQAVVDQAVDQQKKVDEAVVDQAVVDQAVDQQKKVDEAATSNQVDEAGNQALAATDEKVHEAATSNQVKNKDEEVDEVARAAKRAAAAEAEKKEAAEAEKKEAAEEAEAKKEAERAAEEAAEAAKKVDEEAKRAEAAREAERVAEAAKKEEVDQVDEKVVKAADANQLPTIIRRAKVGNPLKDNNNENTNEFIIPEVHSKLDYPIYQKKPATIKELLFDKFHFKFQGNDIDFSETTLVTQPVNGSQNFDILQCSKPMDCYYDTLDKKYKRLLIDIHPPGGNDDNNNIDLLITNIKNEIKTKEEEIHYSITECYRIDAFLKNNDQKTSEDFIQFTNNIIQQLFDKYDITSPFLNNPPDESVAK